MSRHILSLSPEQLTAFDLDAFVAHAELLNQHNRETFTTPFPKAPSRWLSHYPFSPQAMALTSGGEVDSGQIPLTREQNWVIGREIRLLGTNTKPAFIRRLNASVVCCLPSKSPASVQKKPILRRCVSWPPRSNEGKIYGSGYAQKEYFLGTHLATP
jgi:hypothetical protein